MTETPCASTSDTRQPLLEWTAGFGNRYAIVYVDFKTQTRTATMSASFFREVAKGNAVV